MKRCPECRRDYTDDSLLYCLDDGVALLTGSGSVPDLRDEPATAILNPTNGPAAPQASVLRFWLWSTIALGILLLATLGFIALRRPNAASQKPVAVFTVSLPEKTELNLIRYPAIDIAPDGSAIVFSGTIGGVTRLYIRKRNDAEVRLLAGTEGASYPVFSPDGKWVAFSADFTLKKISLDGLIVPIQKVGDARGLAWADDETLIYSPEAAMPLYRISAGGGTPEQLTELDPSKSERTHRWPHVLPGRKAVMFTVGTIDTPDSYENANIEAQVLATGERKVILEKANTACYSPSGHLIFVRGGSLYSVKFDPVTLTTSGPTESVMQSVAGDATTGAFHYAIDDTGTLVYIPGTPSSNSRGVFWVDRAGNSQPVNVPPGQYNDVRVSPDGSRMAILVGSSGSGDVWIYDFARATSTRISFTNKNASPVWSADGKYVYYTEIDTVGSRTTVMRKPADGSRDAEAVGSIDNTAYLKAVENDQTSGIMDYRMNTNRGDLVRIPLGSDGPPTHIITTDFNEYASALSRDGRWLAYQSNESGRPEIYVRDLSGSGGRWQVSNEGGEEPRWSSDGRELFFRNGALFMSVAVNNRTTFEAGVPKTLFNGAFNLRSNSGVSYDVDPKGGRFLMIRPSQADAATPAAMIKVILNWSDELGQAIEAK